MIVDAFFGLSEKKKIKTSPSDAGLVYLHTCRLCNKIEISVLVTTEFVVRIVPLKCQYMSCVLYSPSGCFHFSVRYLIRMKMPIKEHSNYFKNFNHLIPIVRNQVRTSKQTLPAFVHTQRGTRTELCLYRFSFIRVRITHYHVTR